MIRSATKEDLDELVELGQILTKHEERCDPYLESVSEEDNRAHYSKELDNPSARFFVYEVNDEIVGYIYGYIKEAPDHIRIDKGIGHIEACVVKEEHRGKKISSELTKALLDWFKGQKITLIELGVYADNESIEIWKKLGFKPHHVVMRKSI